jgi:ABC-type branched-subunit amino acid transport system ATPase component
VPAVVLRDLRMTFPGKRGGPPVPVLDGISLEVRRGEFVALVVPSGCGKSTLLNILGGFQPATSGLVLVGGEPVPGPDSRRIFVFQESAVFPWLTAQDNVAFGVREPDPAGAPRRSPATSTWWGCAASRRPTRASFPAACGNASSWRAPWPPGRRRSGWTGRSGRWTGREGWRIWAAGKAG